MTVNLAVAIATQCGVCPMIYGMPGTAKTAWFRALAESADRAFIQCILRQMMPEDIGGVPVPRQIELNDDTYDAVVSLPNEQMLRARHEPTLLLFDELNHAGHDVLGAAQEWINNPPPNCWMAACSNPVEQSTSGVELSPPVVNRMCVLQWRRPVEARRKGWRNGFMNYPAPDVPIVPNDFLSSFGPEWGDALCEFEDRFPSAFGDEAYPKNEQAASDPWPSDRSWTNVGILMSGADAVYADAGTRADLVYGCVGQAHGTQFLSHLSLSDLPDPEEILRHPDHLREVLPKTFHAVRAVWGGLIGAVKKNRTAERWESLFDCLEHTFTVNPEAAMAAEGTVWKVKPEQYEARVRPHGPAKEMREARENSQAS